MSVESAGELSLGERLLALGWRQGSFFRSRDLRFSCAAIDPQSVDDPPIATRAKKKGETFVLVSQTCDVVANYDSEPYLEALLCKPETNSSLLAAADQNSARWFLVDPRSNLVAHARYRIVIDKHVLTALTPEPWPGDATRFDWFVRWLARRYDRPAIPEALVAAFQRPAEAAVRQLAKSDLATIHEFSRAVREVRVSVPSSETLPYHLHVVVLLKRTGLTSAQLLAIQAVMSAIRGAVDSEVVAVHSGHRILSPEEISLAEFLATRPLFLEYLTYQGETAAESAVPIDRG